jgi:hypothetical protein
MGTNAEGFTWLSAEQPARTRSASGLHIVVLFTSTDATSAALGKARALSDGLGAQILLLRTRVVPYPLDLPTPTVTSFEESRLREFVAQLPSEKALETTVLLCFCRDEWEALRTALPPDSLVVLGPKRRWWPSREKMLARKLRRAGHDVVFA